MKKLSIAGALGAGLLMLASSLTQAAAISGQGTWETTLQGRDLDGNLATAEAYYDTVLGITWLGDANYAKTTGYDADGKMSGGDAHNWIFSLNPYGSGITGWRRPNTLPVNGMGVYVDYWASDGSSDQGYNMSAPGSVYPGSTGSEMAYLFYNILANSAYRDMSGNYPQPGWGLSNTGPFANVQSGVYSSGTDHPSWPWGMQDFWFFDMSDGSQGIGDSSSSAYTWAVHDGDVGTAIVPVPAALWLFGSGLLGLGAVVRKRRR